MSAQKTFRGSISRIPRKDEMEILGGKLHGIRRQCDADRGHPKPVVSITKRQPLPELAELRRGVAELVYQALAAGVSPNTVLQNCGIGIDLGAQWAQVPVEAAR